MDFEDVEDMLFSGPDSQKSFDDIGNEQSDDEEMLEVADNECESNDDLFDAPVEVTADSWRLLSSPLLTAADISLQQQDSSSTSGTCLMINKARPEVVGNTVPRDRYYGESMTRSAH